jgi:hypothetical protein
MKLFILFFLCFPPLSQALNIKMRAREHYETHTLKLQDGAQAKFSGFSNTINLWHEVPYRYAFGLSLSPVIGRLKAQDPQSKELFREKINFKAYGFEGKLFPFQNSIYLRQGLYAHEFDRLAGWGALTTVGYEYPFTRLGVALEAGQRLYFLGAERGRATSVAIGFHFYKF